MPKLLLADDSVTIQRVIELTFADEDIDVITVGDGQRAIERIDADRPDIVLADVGMPERDGYEVSSYVKRHPQLGHVPVILLTGAFERIDEPRARAAGADGVLAKPFEPQAVINQVRELLARRRSRTAPVPEAVVPPAPVHQSPMQPWQQAPRAAAPVSESADDRMWTTPDADAAAANASDSLDEYFDRLDAAFANMSAAPTSDTAFGGRRIPAVDHVRPTLVHREIEAAPAVVAEPLSEAPPPTQGPVVSHPTLVEARVPERGAESPRAEAGDPRGEAVQPASTALSAPAPSAAVAPPATPPLADAFAALLAAERGEPAARGPAPAEAPSPDEPVQVTDALVEEVTRRVLERLSDRIVRETVVDMVLQVADRLVREEIERIKAAVR